MEVYKIEPDQLSKFMVRKTLKYAWLLTCIIAGSSRYTVADNFLARGIDSEGVIAFISLPITGWSASLGKRSSRKF